MPDIEAQTGFDGELRVRVIRHRPTLRQRVADWLLRFRRF